MLFLSRITDFAYVLVHRLLILYSLLSSIEVMSGGPGGGVPDCRPDITNSGFILPTFFTEWDVGQDLDIAWHGGKVDKKTSHKAVFDLMIAHSSKTKWNGKQIYSN